MMSRNLKDGSMEISFQKLLSEWRVKAKLKKPKLDWANSAAKVFLKNGFKNGLIPTNYSKMGGPRKVWVNLLLN